MSETANRRKQLFLEALELNAKERAAFLERECGDEAMRQEIEAMLQAHGAPDSFLEKPAAEMGATVDDAVPPMVAVLPDEHIGQRIGPYKLREQLGEGGMGIVYVAEQQEPVRRMVALKIIKPGMDSGQILARFEAERQALALMDHPNIAKVLDAGATADGRPFFVMELVKGTPITTFCDANKLPPRKRLELFVRVCQAIQHAHQKGIIHRDIKPSNVLVALYDDEPVPKVIDFGIAKAAGPQLTDRTLQTGFGAIVGTLEYMSPEQTKLNQLDVDTRSDIYSLGVLLYELLTGSTPLGRERIKAQAMLEVLRLIHEEEPPRPSVKLSSKQGRASIQTHGSEPDKLSQLLRGELDWIVMKSLEKDRTRRYEAAASFARDVERYLKDELVEARPPSLGYRLGKTIRKNRGLFIAASLVILTLIGGVIGTTWGMLLAEKRLTQVEKGNEILASIFKDLNPMTEEKEGKPLRALLGERLDRAAKELDGDSVGQPHAVMALQDQLGVALIRLGYPEKAIPLFAKLHAAHLADLGAGHLHTHNTGSHLALAYRDAGKIDQAVALYEELLKACQAANGPEHITTLNTKNNLAGAYYDAGKRDQAVALQEEVFKQGITTLEPEDPLLLTCRDNLAAYYSDAGKHDQAMSLHSAVIKVYSAKLGPEHPNTLVSMNNLGVSYARSGQLDQAIPLFEKVLKARTVRLGPEHPETLHTMADLANTYARVGNHDKATPLFIDALRLRTAKLGPEHWRTLESMYDLAWEYVALGKRDQAMPLFEEALRLRKIKLGPEHPHTLKGMEALGWNLLKAKRPAEAERPLRECLTLREKTQPNDWRTFNTKALLGQALLGLKKYADAEPLLQSGYEGMRQREAKITPANKIWVADALVSLVQLYEATQNKQKAEEWRKKLNETQPRDPRADPIIRTGPTRVDAPPP